MFFSEGCLLTRFECSRIVSYDEIVFKLKFPINHTLFFYQRKAFLI